MEFRGKNLNAYNIKYCGAGWDPGEKKPIPPPPKKVFLFREKIILKPFHSYFQNYQVISNISPRVYTFWGMGMATQLELNIIYAKKYLPYVQKMIIL